MSDLISSIRLFVVSLLVCCVFYPTLILGFAMIAAPESRLGSLLYDQQGRVVGSRLLAQKFSRPEYFWPRPSAVNYDASATGGSNLSPTNPKLTEAATERIRQLNLQNDQPIPADLVCMSGSGVDPHLSLAAAKLQFPRITQSRNISESKLEEIVAQHFDAPTLQVLGAGPLINVLELNLALDQMNR